MKALVSISRKAMFPSSIIIWAKETVQNVIALRFANPLFVGGLVG